ncbi:hypothetical protein Plhal304r1_c083g0167691 [Plasmopara halstedii]
MFRRIDRKDNGFVELSDHFTVFLLLPTFIARFLAQLFFHLSLHRCYVMSPTNNDFRA